MCCVHKLGPFERLLRAVVRLNKSMSGYRLALDGYSHTLGAKAMSLSGWHKSSCD